MYVIDYKNKLIKKFNQSDLANFLNNKYDKNRFIFCNNKINTKKVLNFCIR